MIECEVNFFDAKANEEQSAKQAMESGRRFRRLHDQQSLQVLCGLLGCPVACLKSSNSNYSSVLADEKSFRVRSGLPPPKT